MSKALVVEDDVNVRGALLHILGIEGFCVLQAQTAGEALAKIARENPDIIVLDVMLPDGNGFDLCKQTRDICSAPVLMLTALADEASVLEGFHAGADDYIAKPFRPREFVARVRSILKRAGVQDSGQPREIRIGDIVFYPERQTARVDGRTVCLSPTETKLLLTLLNREGQVLRPDLLAEQVWHCRLCEREAQDLVKTAVSRLRAKIEADRQHPRHILTVRGKGYTLARDKE